MDADPICVAAVLKAGELCLKSGVESLRPPTQQKALHLNLDPGKYGTLAEIGAGQEVARWFFQAGRAAGTIAKTISAYDMAVSDAIYGHAHRYVCRERLVSMLDHEYGLLLERLDERRGGETCFFAFADTVATRGPGRDGGDGWLGVRFQHEPRAEPSQVLMHVSMLDRTRVHEQETLGILGVNLLYGVFVLRDDPVTLIASLVDDLSHERVEIDMVRFSGPAFAAVDNRLMALQLVEQGLTDAAMFTADGEVVQPSEVLYRKPVLVERGRFRPLTHMTLDILRRAHDLFLEDPDLAGEEPVVVMEMTLRDLGGAGSIAHEDFLARVDTLRTVGKTVLVSRFVRFFRLVEYLSRYTQKRIGLAIGVPILGQVTDRQFYTDLPGGALEGAGRLFRSNVRLYVAPTRDAATGAVIAAEAMTFTDRTQQLFYHLLIESGFIVPLRNFQEEWLQIRADDVLAQIAAGDAAWEASVPPPVAEVIKRERLFGYDPKN